LSFINKVVNGPSFIFEELVFEELVFELLIFVLVINQLLNRYQLHGLSGQINPEDVFE